MASEFPTPSPTDFALSVFTQPIVSDEIVSDEVGGDVSSLHKECLNRVMHTLTKYGYDPMLYKNRKPMVAIKKAGAFEDAKGHDVYQKERTNYIYCKRCFNNVPTKEEFSCCVIAITRYGGLVESKPFVEVIALFPHSNECTTPLEYRWSTKIDKSIGGRGWDIIQFPLEELLRGTYNDMLATLNGIPRGGDHKGENFIVTVFLYISFMSNPILH